MGNFERFVIENQEADIYKLSLSCREWPSTEGLTIPSINAKDLALNTIEARKKLAGKVPEWHDVPSLVYPSVLSAEQCSSSVTSAYKAALASRILKEDAKASGRIADLTGGLGVDSWAFSSVASEVLYNEMSAALAAAAAHNFRKLGISNIRVSDKEVSNGAIGGILDGFNPDIIFLDPARRGSDGGKVFLLEDCSPNVLSLIPELFLYSRNILLKLSPMADIGMAVERLNRSYEAYLESVSGSGWNGNWVREIHVVASGGECKELLVWMDADWKGEYTLTCREDGGSLSFNSGEIAGAKPVLPESAYVKYLFEPGKSLSKAGVFNIICERFGLVKLGRFTHLFTFPDAVSKEEARDRLGILWEMGKVFEVEEVLKMNKAAIRDVGKRFPRSEVSARNIPLTSVELRSRLGVKSGEDAHIFGAKIDTPFESGNFLLVANRI